MSTDTASTARDTSRRNQQTWPSALCVGNTRPHMTGCHTFDCCPRSHTVSREWLMGCTPACVLWQSVHSVLTGKGQYHTTPWRTEEPRGCYAGSVPRGSSAGQCQGVRSAVGCRATAGNASWRVCLVHEGGTAAGCRLKTMPKVLKGHLFLVGCDVVCCPLNINIATCEQTKRKQIRYI